MLLLITVLVPFLGALLLLILKPEGGRARLILTGSAALAASLCALFLIRSGGGEYRLLSFGEGFGLLFRLDDPGRVFLGLMAFLWPLTILYASEYMEHEERENTFFCWFLMTYGVMVLFCSAGNLFTMYTVYELITLVTLPLVWHKKDYDSVRAARSYIRYSIGAAGFGFAAVILVCSFGGGDFALGAGRLSDMGNALFAVTFLCGFFGFGVKAAVFPLCNWLPRASVAPTPVTALLHAVAVVNAGVFAVMRLIYDVLGAERIAGTPLKGIALCVSAATVLFGAVLAVRERHVKRKLAWSTVSNLGYMLLGLSLMGPQGRTGALMHMISHGLMKITLFFCVGTVLVRTGRTHMSEFRGLGRRMPVTFTVFLIAALALTGIPPLCGFIGKYCLITAAVGEGSACALIGAASLLVSSVLTAVYALGTGILAFSRPLEQPELLPARTYDPGWRMLCPFCILILAIIVLGAAPGAVLNVLESIAGAC